MQEEHAVEGMTLEEIEAADRVDCVRCGRTIKSRTGPWFSGPCWAATLEARKAWVLHDPSQVVGKVVALIEPNGHEGHDGRKVDAWVLELEEGHRFLAERDNFVELTETEVILYGTVEREIDTVIAGTLLTLGKQGGFDPERAAFGVAVVRAALVAQLRALTPPAT